MNLAIRVGATFYTDINRNVSSCVEFFLLFIHRFATVRLIVDSHLKYTKIKVPAVFINCISIAHKRFVIKKRNIFAARMDRHQTHRT